MLVKKVLTRKQIERLAKTILEDINEDFVSEAFNDVHDGPELMQSFDASEDDDLLEALVTFLGNQEVESFDE